MKKYLLLLLISATFGNVSAQIPNSGFELTNSFGGPSNWGRILLIASTMDSNGVFHTDSIVYDQALYFQTTDAYAGQYALEIHNAFNYTQNYGIAGGVNLLPNDSDYFNFSVPLTTAGQPTALNFYYKFFPVNNDIAEAIMLVYDSLGYQIGEANFPIAGTVSTYTLASVPVVYNAPGDAAAISIFINNARASSQASFGTHLLIDEISYSTATAIDEVSHASDILLFPNPASDGFHIQCKSPYTLKLFNLAGQQQEVIVENGYINCTKLGRGLYTVEITTAEHSFRRKIVIE